MSTMVDLFWHEHPLHEQFAECPFDCQNCHTVKDVNFNEIYECLTCNMEWHISCVPKSPENIDHPCHPNHPLELLLQGPPNYSDGKCSYCQRKLSNFIYHCKLCNINVDLECGRDRPPPHKVDHPKCHEHTLTVMGREVSFTCNACGMQGERNPFVCLPCSLMFHYDCIDLPHVININRHDHRISHAYPLIRGNWVCDICRQDVNSTYGGYACNKCPDYFVHSRCATREDVWDGIELENIPEEELDTAPYKVIAERVISHVSHEEHNLFLIKDVIKDGGNEDIHCEACARPISSEKHYKCMECDFILHEECANLPLKKRHGLSTSILSLLFGKDISEQLFKCVACHRVGSGFSYYDGKDVVLDVRCASLSFFRHHKLHPHTLFLTTEDRDTCIACGEKKLSVLHCVECEHSLDYKCATLPLVIKHRCDAHYLVLSSGEEAPGKYWCEICEAKTNPEKWFYTCNDCGVVCHIECVIGDFLNIKPGLIFMREGVRFEVVLNDHDSRPKCTACGSHCRFPMYFKVTSENIEYYFCSSACLNNA
ncbi:putative chromatin regulator PHD family [Arabidopsis thaliana]